jgi:60 kDa SS-A/Ro ribonucleoprotein
MLTEYELLKNTKDLHEVVRLIEKHGYTHEMVPSEAKAFPEVWEALLVKMPMTAMIRNLNKMTAVGLLKPMGAATRLVQSRLTDSLLLQKARVHPIQMLSALKTYAQGHGERGKLTWLPVREIVDGLDEGFYLSFSNITPTGKNVMLAIDVSGSMDGGEIAGVPGLTPRLGAAAMAMVTARSEKNWHCVAFSSGAPGEFTFGAGKSQHAGFKAGLTELTISPRQRLDDVCMAMKKIPMGGTDCALPMLYAAAKGLHVDAFCIYTDCETWAGDIHPHQALKVYREKTGISAKLAVVAMTADKFSIADPSDQGMLDFVGFDAAAPSVMADFIRR